MTKGHLPGGLAMTITLLWRQGGGATTIWSSIVEWAGCNKSIYLLPLKCMFSARIPLASTLDSSDSARSSSNQFKTIKHFLAKLWLQCIWNGEEKKTIISFLKIEWSLFVKPFICKTLSHLHPRMHYAKFGWNWPNGSGGEDFYIFVNIFSLFVIISPCKRVGPFI